MNCDEKSKKIVFFLDEPCVLAYFINRMIDKIGPLKGVFDGTAANTKNPPVLPPGHYGKAKSKDFLYLFWI